jgi:hypothetical protein
MCYVLVPLLVILVTVPPAAQAPVASKRDLAVLEAVLAHTIRPQVNRFSSGAGLPTPAPVLTFDRTLAICSPGEGRSPMGCMSDEMVVQAFERHPPRMRRMAFEGLLSQGSRGELAADFRARNAISHLLPEGTLTGVIQVSPEDFAEAQKRESRRTIGTTRLSLPAYSMDGYALVYGSYVCGGLCGEGWQFLLKQQADMWTVVSVQPIWIS